MFCAQQSRRPSSSPLPHNFSFVRTLARSRRTTQLLVVNANPCATVASRVITLAVQAQDAAFVVQRVRDVFVCHVVLVQLLSPTASSACVVGREPGLQPLACLLN